MGTQLDENKDGSGGGGMNRNFSEHEWAPNSHEKNAEKLKERK